MTRSAKAKAKRPQGASRRLSRPPLDNMFATLIEPNDKHTVTEHQTRTACGVLLDGLQRRIRDVEGLARLLVRDEVSA
jgi:hypothetical protein